ncbi:MAG: hypothetical protein AABX14_02010 [Candidatus Aenigmatarchaeota archaeon]
MLEKQVFWDTIQGQDDIYSSGSRMYREDDCVFYEHFSFDAEDNMRYTYGCDFSLEQYRRIIEELQRIGKSRIAEPAYTFYIERGAGDDVTITFHGTPSPCSTPGGNIVYGSVHDICRIGDLLPTS